MFHTKSQSIPKNDEGSPNEYAEYYKTGIYPLKEVIEEPAECIEKFKNVKENLDQLSSNVNEISSSKSSS